ncbi:hypothetical protein C0V76_08825 [Uliginosibacterium sp. TH139]|nr:hypothetical protein C0V76_08825 [Uliginosibacterium sp. TH139]
MPPPGPPPPDGPRPPLPPPSPPLLPPAPRVFASAPGKGARSLLPPITACEAQLRSSEYLSPAGRLLNTC